MDKYKILVEKDNIKILKKQNKIKIEINSEVNSQIEFINSFNDFSFFNLIGTLNTDLIERVKIDCDNDKNHVIIVINNIENNDDYDYETKSYLTFYIEKIYTSDSSIKLIGKKNSTIINKDYYEKIDIEEICINLNLVGKNIFLEIKVKYLYNTIPIYTENILGYVLCKIFKRLINHYKK